MIELLYVISVIYIFFAFILCEKSKEKVSFIKFFVISIVLLLCYNMLVCLILNTIGIIINLEILLTINYVIASIITFFIVKNKRIQKYYVKKQSIIYIILLITAALLLAYFNFGKELNIKYVMTDSAVHFSVAREFYESGKLGGQIIGAYTNTGILFKTLVSFIGETNLYKVFIFFDVFLLALMGMIIYVDIEKTLKRDYALITFLMLIFFLIGYPLNIMIYGFVYVQLGVIIIAAIIGILQYLSEEKIDPKWVYTFLALCNFGLFFSYCIFVPIVYLTEFIFVLYRSKKENKKIITKDNIGNILFIFGIPIICGVLYSIVPYLKATGDNPVFYNIEGYIYRNLWSNFVLILPISCVIIKNKNEDSFLWTIFTIMQILFMTLIFIIVNRFNLSTYYYYKYNFVLWFILWYGAIYAINSLDLKIGKYLISYVLVYTLIATICINFKTVRITKELYDDDENISNAFDIYCVNYRVLSFFSPTYEKEEFDIIKFIYNNVDLKKDKILIIGNELEEHWFRAFFNYSTRDNLQSIIPPSEVAKWNNGDYKYLLIFYNNKAYDIYKPHISKGNVLIENKKGILYMNKKSD